MCIYVYRTDISVFSWCSDYRCILEIWHGHTCTHIYTCKLYIPLFTVKKVMVKLEPGIYGYVYNNVFVYINICIYISIT